jgi:hypothetical protein
MTHIPFLFSQNSVFTGFIRKEISEDDEDEEELERNHVRSLHDIRSQETDYNFNVYIFLFFILISSMSRF